MSEFQDISGTLYQISSQEMHCIATDTWTNNSDISESMDSGHPLLSADIRQILVSKEEPLDEQGCSPSLDQEDTKPPHIKEEQEELWISQDAEQIQGQEDTDIKFPITVKSENDEETPQFLPLEKIKPEQMETGADGEDLGGSEQARNSDSERDLHPEIEVTIEESSEPEAEDCNNVKCTTVYQSGLKSVERLKDQGLQNIEKMHRCTECGKIFKRKSYLTVHMKIHTRACSKSGRPSSINERLAQHRSKMLKKSFSCPKCGKTFNCKSHVKVHLRTHKGKKPFSTSKCDKRFRYRGHLTDHLRTHTEVKPCRCPECGRGFRQKRYLREHLKTHKRTTPFNCSECGKSFIYKSVFKAHLTSHTGEKPFSCSDCGKRYRKEQSLKEHLIIHTGETPFSCPECGNRYRKKRHLTEHLTTHTGEIPHSCPECGKRFIHRDTFTRHMLSHTRGKLFSCPECNKAFDRKEHLTAHIRIHTGEKPFVCSECNKEFAQKEI
ncbi:gastrula zinc finger protein XlCGF57.1-like [Cheilinus undulatus]|uniref:gastrula zinc finger protein XlCGF57.1-like n=1 Tax=Cheilinus undulatus TaxID=241271 RepID=UPI001BD2CD1D|nr:gastrula zinc finger protein XlCGF57.1-like [Cheilinus undulatus]